MDSITWYSSSREPMTSIVPRMKVSFSVIHFGAISAERVVGWQS